ncbi:MAG: ATP-binding protein [Thermodesulfobacteriota bacterium]
MSKEPKLVWRLFPTYFLVTFLAVVAMGWGGSSLLKSAFYEETFSELKTQAILVGEMLQIGGLGLDAAGVDDLVKRVGNRIQSRITVILPSGKVVGDSARDPSLMEDHSRRAEVQTALEGKVGHSERVSGTIGKRLLYVAVPIVQDGEVKTVVRTSMQVRAITDALHGLYLRIVAEGAVVVLLAALMSLYISHRIKKPIEDFKEAAARFARGDLDYRLEIVPDSQELASLVESINTMAAELRSRMQKIVDQRKELEAILAGMKEAVLLIGPDERIVRVNRAAVQLFEFSHTPMEGKDILYVIRNSEFREFVQNTLSAEGALSCDIVVWGPPERFFQAYGARLRDSEGKVSGVLLVLNDVTRLRNLEQVRRDFVTNASHQLKTPLTPIKGFLESLEEELDRDPEKAKRFVKIIAKNVQRMESLVEGMLTLARAEEVEGTACLELRDHSVRDMLDAVVENSMPQAQIKGVRLEVECEPHLSAMMNEALLGKAIASLVENAIRVSKSGSIVSVQAYGKDSEACIKIADQGSGISAKDAQRIFERFYQTQPQPGGEKGGAGLGLSVAKHIVMAHGGRIEVESIRGKGTSFTVHLPAGSV